MQIYAFVHINEVHLRFNSFISRRPLVCFSDMQSNYVAMSRNIDAYGVCPEQQKSTTEALSVSKRTSFSLLCYFINVHTYLQHLQGIGHFFFCHCLCSRQLLQHIAGEEPRVEQRKAKGREEKKKKNLKIQEHNL